MRSPAYFSCSANTVKLKSSYAKLICNQRNIEGCRQLASK